MNKFCRRPKLRGKELTAKHGLSLKKASNEQDSQCIKILRDNYRKPMQSLEEVSEM